MPSSAGICLPPSRLCSSCRSCSASTTATTSPRPRRATPLFPEPPMPPDSLRNTNGPALKRRLRSVGIVVAICAVLIVTYGLVSRAAQTAHLRDQTDERAVPTVVLISPKPTKGETGLELPGRLQAYISAPIYARVSGYLKDWKHDIGSKVRAGDVLAEIDTPDLDQQLAQARADLSVAQAN